MSLDVPTGDNFPKSCLFLLHTFMLYRQMLYMYLRVLYMCLLYTYLWYTYLLYMCYTYPLSTYPLYTYPLYTYLLYTYLELIVGLQCSPCPHYTGLQCGSWQGTPTINTHTHTLRQFTCNNTCTKHILNLPIKINARKVYCFSEGQFSFSITCTKHVLTYL